MKNYIFSEFDFVGDSVQKFEFDFQHGCIELVLYHQTPDYFINEGSHLLNKSYYSFKFINISEYIRRYVLKGINHLNLHPDVYQISSYHSSIEIEDLIIRFKRDEIFAKVYFGSPFGSVKVKCASFELFEVDYNSDGIIQESKLIFHYSIISESN